MTRDRLVQLIAIVILLVSLTASGTLLPGIIRQSDDNVMRYTNVSVEGAPPFVALGTAIGALRGLIVDYLWIKVNSMKEKGLFYEEMADADLITKLQPRFAAVWAFLGHNMAYNISVATHTPQERWEWVNAGIRLVRSEGLRYNPNDIELHRELAFWFAHKIEGVSDDAHLYYKLRFCDEWNSLLGEPPDGWADRTAWMKAVADAPETLAEAEQRTPGVMALTERFQAARAKDQPQLKKALDRQFLTAHTTWVAVTQKSQAAKILGVEKQYHDAFPALSALFDEVGKEPASLQALNTLVLHVCKRVLKDEYNMDPQLMYEYTRDLGPIDWRHGQAHALYWSRRGSQFGKGRLSDDDAYIALNNDSQQMQAMQDLARSGRISYDPFSNEFPGRFPDPRWIDTIDNLFEPMYLKYYNMRGAGGERFINFLQNFMGSAICEWYRSGETDKAQKIMDRLDKLFGGTGPTANPTWHGPIDAFVQRETHDQYQAQPHTAPRDIWASLRYGLKVSILTPGGRPDVLRDALRFANTVTRWFKDNSWNDFTTKTGDKRIADTIGELEDSVEIAYLQMITDPGITMRDRMNIWAGTDRIESQVTGKTPTWRALVYDRAMPLLEKQLQNSEMGVQFKIDQAFPAPPGLDAARQFLLDRQKEREQKKQQERERDPFTRKS